MLKDDQSFQRRWEIVLADNETSIEKPPFYIRRFFLILVLLGLLGGFLALTVPLWKSWAETPKTNCIKFIIGWIGSLLSSFIPPSDADKYPEGKVIADLRQHILYITGGVIAILTLLQTNWKNQVDRCKVEDDIQKNKKDHDRQVHAERRSRYTKAVEQLADEKAAVRLGGIYTLVSLVDEWLADDTLDSKEQQEEGQVIINNLCAYIRSPFPLAEKIEEYEARKELKELEEKESEKLSAKESLRLKALHARFKESDEYTKPEDITADYAKLHEEQDVRRNIFLEISRHSGTAIKDMKNRVNITNGVWNIFDFNFSRAPIFYSLEHLKIEKAIFSHARFYGNASLSSVTFIQDAHFSNSTFTNEADFQDAIFAKDAYFIDVNFIQDARFIGTDFERNLYFTNATFTQDAWFYAAIFVQSPAFFKATFTQNASFLEATFFNGADFLNTTFNKSVDFTAAVFKNCIPTFVHEYNKSIRTRFSALSNPGDFSNPGDYKFSVITDDEPIIRLGTANLLGKRFFIPVGTVLFNPDSWDPKKKDHITSAPAVPVKIN